MKFGILIGNPRKNGNTKKLLDPLIERLASQGADFECIWLYDKKLSYSELVDNVRRTGRFSDAGIGMVCRRFLTKYFHMMLLFLQLLFTLGIALHL
ncbi:MAG: NAD(P)H-dependent oxidoreductase [Clostridiaceae bacterium]